MKTYADLTGLELITLANLALNFQSRGYPLSGYKVERHRHPEKKHITIVSVKLENSEHTAEVRFGPVTGDIWRPEDEGEPFQRIYNQWTIVGLCLKWGVDYFTPRPGVESADFGDSILTPFSEARDKFFNR